MPTGFTYKGLQQMRKRAATLAKKFPDEAGRALYIEIETEVKEAKRRTPVDRGNLRASIHQEGPTRRGRIIGTAIVAGGPSAPYAIYVHENLDAFHEVGQAKFIESVIFEVRPHLMKRVARRIELNRALA